MESIAEDEAKLTAEPETTTEEIEDGIEPVSTEGNDPKDGRSSATEARSDGEGAEGDGRRGRLKRGTGRSSSWHRVELLRVRPGGLPW